MATKWIYSFSDGKAEGNADMSDLLGGKGANLAEMASMNLPVPPGFTITTDACRAYFENNNDFPIGLKEEAEKALKKVEKLMGRTFGDEENPLLVSVRSGAKVSMPGMMDTVLNLGLNDVTVQALARRSGDERFAYDSYRRFIQMFGDVVLGVSHNKFEAILTDVRKQNNCVQDTDLTSEDLKTCVERFKACVREQTGEDFPQDTQQQLWMSIDAVFKSWTTDRAVSYRMIHHIPHDLGTAVNIQSMVFGNMGNDCATGVCFTRDPSTGGNAFYGEYLVNAQGEDVVAGIRTPQQLTIEERKAQNSEIPSLEETMPKVYKELCQIRAQLEEHYYDMQDIEFTVEKEKLYILQTRSGKRTARAALKIACDMVDEGLITEQDATLRIEPESLNQLLHPILDPKAAKTVIATGLPASPGAASGQIVFSADAAEEKAKRGQSVILVRIETSPEDINGMEASRGILTSRGGMTSHAAVVARGMGKVCVAGAGEIEIDYEKGTLTTGGVTLKEGDNITIEGSTGHVMKGFVPTIDPEPSEELNRILEWADRERILKVRANAETRKDVKAALKFGAEGIGLCRTEHMFFEPERVIVMRQMMLADSPDERQMTLEQLMPMQRGDFENIFKLMEDRPVTIRLLDPPLHEFMPKTQTEMMEMAEFTGATLAEIETKVKRLHESNPMLGHRGCRLGISYPEIYAMQARAIFEAAYNVKSAYGIDVKPEIMIPLIASAQELIILRMLVDEVARDVLSRNGITVDYKVGTMIELPRAALRAASIAESADFFSFGTNDLTQTAFGISRDDAAGFLDDYKQNFIFDRDPFVSIDQSGVGELVEMAAERGRQGNPDLHLGICGEHGGDPDSVRFFADVGLDYVSCSPFRILIARLAAGQAALIQKGAKQGTGSKKSDSKSSDKLGRAAA